MTSDYTAIDLTAAERAVMPATVAGTDDPTERARQEYLWLVERHFSHGHCPITPPVAYRERGDVIDLVAREEGATGGGVFGNTFEVTFPDRREVWDGTEQARRILAHIRRCPAGLA